MDFVISYDLVDASTDEYLDIESSLEDLFDKVEKVARTTIVGYIELDATKPVTEEVDRIVSEVQGIFEDDYDYIHIEKLCIGLLKDYWTFP